VNIEKAVRYHRLKRRAGIAATVLSTTVLAALLTTGASEALRDFAARATGTASATVSAPAAIAAYVVVLCACLQAAALPMAWYNGVVLERRYGLSSETAARWLGDYLKAAAVSATIAVAAAELVYGAIRRWPNLWWLAAAIGGGAAVLLLARAAPIALLPLFYRFKPLERPLLQDRLRTLSLRAGAPVLGVYEWGLGEKTRRANAALVGVGSTRRILLSDTLLADYSDDEIEVILAHELAHHAHRDVLKGVGAQTSLLLLGFAAAAGAFEVLGTFGINGWRSPADVAGLPVLLLAVGAVSVVLSPLVHALSRRHERRADAYALKLTNQPAAFVSAMRRLGAQNLAEPQPSRAAVWLFHSHPPIEERIDSARRFEAADLTNRGSPRNLTIRGYDGI
jgi:STE24 endopeptidase